MCAALGPNPDKQSNFVYAIQCQEECNELYIGENYALHKRMAQHRRATSSGQDSAVHLHLKESGPSFEESEVCWLEREDRWLEMGVWEAIHVKLKKNIFKPGWWLKTLPVTHIQRSAPLTGAKFQTLTPFDETWYFTNRQRRRHPTGTRSTTLPITLPMTLRWPSGWFQELYCETNNMKKHL